jgi:thioredoxin-dependent peroxiredoxin
MALQLGDIAPNFIAETTQGTLNFYDFIHNSWAVLFSHPADYTPVCTTELGVTAKLQLQFAQRNTKVIALSVDAVSSHNSWIQDINETQNCEVNYPIIADTNKEVSNLYGMLHPNASETATVRSVFIIGPDKKVKLTLTYPMSVGRNFNEILRVLDSLQLSAKLPISTPANWEPGQQVIVGLALSTEAAKEKFPNLQVVKPYLRYTSLD